MEWKVTLSSMAIESAFHDSAYTETLLADGKLHTDMWCTRAERERWEAAIIFPTISFTIMILASVWEQIPLNESGRKEAKAWHRSFQGWQNIWNSGPWQCTLRCVVQQTIFFLTKFLKNRKRKMNASLEANSHWQNFSAIFISLLTIFAGSCHEG